MTTYDAIVVGGGPAGSACAGALARAGLRVAVLDRQRFPRVKLCAGWLSPPVWDVLEISPRSYPAGLWEWSRCHVYYRGRRYTSRVRGYFIRRCEFDEFLLRRSGAALIEGHGVRRIERDPGGSWIVDGAFAAKVIIGAGGTHCPVARHLFPRRARRPVAVQEREFPAPVADVAATRIGRDGEPELLLHDDLGGYSWNVPKTDWLNIGCGTAEARKVLAAWRSARAFFADSGHVPSTAFSMLERMEGHSYYQFDAGHLGACQQSGAFLVGDALGLAHPLTAEGILPAVLSGRLCAEAILAGTPDRYRERLEGHPLFEDYRLWQELLALGSALGQRVARRRWPAPERFSKISRWAVARGFAWAFSGRPIAGAGLVGRLARGLGSMARPRTEVSAP